MARTFPEEIDEYFIIDIILSFLMINFSLPLATIYLGMVLIGSFMYYVVVDQSFFKWIPFSQKKSNKLVATAVGAGLGIAFIWFYNTILLNPTPMAAVFATTAFGESELIGKLLFGILIAIVETRFFFRTIMQFFSWKNGININNGPFSLGGVQVMIFFSAIFTLFHATAKGIDNNLDLVATFIFGMLSIGLILFFKEWIQATILHIYINSSSVGLFETLTKGALLSNPFILIGGLGAIIFLFTRGRRAPFLA